MNERNPFRRVKLFLAAYFALLVLALTAIGCLNWLGYRMADLSIQFALLGLLICSALIAGGVALVKRISAGGLKFLAGTICAVLVFVVAAGMLLLFSAINFSSMPIHYTTLESPQGKKAVVLRSLSQDQEAADIRRAERIAATPDADPDEYVFAEMGYLYTAHPAFAGLFYNMKVSCTGSVEIGCGSAAELMYDWPEENTLHLYIKNPEPGDAGELTLVLE